MNLNDDYLYNLCCDTLEVRSTYINDAVCGHCGKAFAFADGVFGIMESKSLICCPYCDTYDYRMCDLKDTIMKRNLFWR